MHDHHFKSCELQDLLTLVQWPLWATVQLCQCSNVHVVGLFLLKMVGFSHSPNILLCIIIFSELQELKATLDERITKADTISGRFRSKPRVDSHFSTLPPPVQPVLWAVQQDDSSRYVWSDNIQGTVINHDL